MAWLFYLGGFATFGFAFLVLKGSESAIHEILAACLLIISSNLFTGGAIVEAVNKSKRD